MNQETTDGRPPMEHAVGTTETSTFILLFEASAIALKLAKENTEGSFYHSLHSIVSTAFGLEAYMNHLGRHLFPGEQEFNWRPTGEKFEVICAKFGFSPDKGTRPYQALPMAFAARNLAAHSTTVTVGFDRIMRADRMPPPERSPLELECTSAKAETLYQDALEIVRDLHKRSGRPEWELMVTNSTAYIST